MTVQCVLLSHPFLVFLFLVGSGVAARSSWYLLDDTRLDTDYLPRVPSSCSVVSKTFLLPKGKGATPPQMGYEATIISNFYSLSDKFPKPQSHHHPGADRIVFYLILLSSSYSDSYSLSTRNNSSFHSNSTRPRKAVPDQL